MCIKSIYQPNEKKVYWFFSNGNLTAAAFAGQTAKSLIIYTNDSISQTPKS